MQAPAEDGWKVTAASRAGGRDERWADEIRAVAPDRDAKGALAAALGDAATYWSTWWRTAKSTPGS